MKTKGHTVVSHVFPTAMKGSVGWLWNVTTLTKVRQWDTRIMHLTLTRKNEHRRKLGRIQEKDGTNNARNMGQPTMAEQNAEQSGKLWPWLLTMRGSGHESTSFILAWGTRHVAEQKETQIRVSQQTRDVGHPFDI